jgi:hypothetical protein
VRVLTWGRPKNLGGPKLRRAIASNPNFSLLKKRKTWEIRRSGKFLIVN